MDIQIVKAIVSEDGKWLDIHRTFDGKDLNIEHTPIWTLDARAAEYNLDTRDPMALEILLLERFWEGPRTPIHPLFAAGTVSEALDIMVARIDTVRNKHAAPAQLILEAVRANDATQGAVSTANRLQAAHDGDRMRFLRGQRERLRREYGALKV